MTPAHGSEAAAPAPGGGPRFLGPVSAVICNYNGEHYLRDCLRSIEASEEGVDEIVVVDNGSTDGSLDLLRSEFPRAKVVPLARNGGPCAARNAGMRAARNRWVLAIDNDAVLAPDLLSKLRVALEQDPTAVMAQPRSVFDSEPSRVHYDGAAFHYVGLLSLRNFYRPVAQAEGVGTVPVDGAIAIAILLDRDTVLGVGGYDEDFFILFEDYDLSQRLRLLGHRILSVEDAIVRHKGGTPGISFRQGSYPKQRSYYHSRNRWILLAKNHRVRTLLGSLPGILVYEIAWLAFAVRSGHLRAWVAGKWDFLRNLPAVLRKRRVIQRARVVRDRDLLVGDPLTLSPELTHDGRKAAVVRALNGVLRAWWRVARPLSD